MCMYAYVYVYVCIYVCINIFTYTLFILINNQRKSCCLKLMIDPGSSFSLSIFGFFCLASWEIQFVYCMGLIPLQHFYQVSLFQCHFSHSCYDCSFRWFFSLCFMFYFVFPQGSESFWKCYIICFVQHIFCHTCTMYLASFNSPSKYFLLVITSTFFSSLLNGWGWDLFSVLFIAMFQCVEEYLTYYVFSKYMLRQWIKVGLTFLFKFLMLSCL